MKRLITILLAVIFSATAMAQAPEGVNYQALARDAGGDPMTNESIAVRMTIKESGPAGTTVYQETHSTSTNDFGLFSLTVGQGSVVSGTFSNIDWGSNSHFIQVEVDPGSGYVNLGTTQLVSVPYALYAKEAGNAGTSYNAGTGIDISGNTISNTGDTDPTDDITNTSNAGGDVSGTFNNLTVEGLQGRTVSGTAPSSGEVLKWNGSTWAPANDVGGGAGDDWGSQVVQSDATLTGDGTSGNDLGLAQQGASSGEVLKWDGSAWAPATDATGGGGGSVWTTSGSDIFYNAGNVGIGIGNPAEALRIEGEIQFSNGPERFDVGVNSDGQLAFFPNGNSNEFVVMDDNNDYLGVGTNNPDHTLHVEGGKAMIGSPNGVIAKMTVNSTETDEEIFRGRKNGFTHFIINEDGHVGIQDGTPANELSVDGNVDITENLGIGTSDPQEDIVVHKSSGPEMVMRNTSGSGEIGYKFSSQPGAYYSGMTFDVSSDVMDFYNNHSGGVITFSTNGERMRVSSGGGVGIGETSPSEDLEVGDADNDGTVVAKIGDNSGDRIEIGSLEYIEDVGGHQLEINATIQPDIDDAEDLGTPSFRYNDVYSANGVTTTSDRNAKEDIQSMQYGLNDIMALEPVTYKSKNEHHPVRKNSLGLIAQDVKPVISEVVKTHNWKRTEDGTFIREEIDLMGINYGQLVPVAIKAIQEQQEEIEKLQKENNDLKQHLNKLEKRVEQLEK